MRKEHTVLVLGAGASIPYGFPSGPELVTIVIGALFPKADERVVGDIQAVTGEDRAKILDFGNKLYHSRRASIDVFLEHQPEFLDVGRAAIAHVLIRREDPKKLYEQEEGFRAQAWYEYFLNYVLPSSPKELRDLRLTVVTFNYDRSFEQFLFATLSTYIPETQVIEILSRFRFIHIYGSLARLHWQNGSGQHLDYEPSLTSSRLEIGRKGIAVMSQTGEDETGYAEASKSLQQAGRIFFLGHGYHEDAVSRLLKGIGTRKNGTTIDLGRTRAAALHQNWGFDLPNYQVDTVAFLKDHGQFD